MRPRSRIFWMSLALLSLALTVAGAPCVSRIAAAMPAPIAPAQADCATTSCSIFLPVISVPLIAPTLNDPPDQAQVDSIAPTLTWTPAITGTKYFIEVATAPDFAASTIIMTNTKTISLLSQDIERTVPGKNLNASTTYYWRVGVLLPEGIHYSTVAQFTTAPYDPARLPPPPTLLSPADGARLTTLTPTLTWAAATGADAYRAQMLNADGTTIFKTGGIIQAPKTSTTFTGLLSKIVYYWHVKVHNSYGWGDYGPSPGWRFRTP